VSAHSERRIRARGRGNRDTSFLRQIFRGFLRLCILAIVILCVWYGTRWTALTIESVTVDGGETISHEEVRGLTERELNGTYFLLIPKRFTYLYPQERILEVLEKIPRIHNIHIERTSHKNLHVSFDEYLPHALTCLYGKPEAPCFLMDIRGFAFAPAPMLSGGAFVRHSIEGVNEIIQGNVIEESRLAEIDTFLEKIEDELALRVSAVVYRNTGDIEFLVNGGGAILTSGGRDFDETFENLRILLASNEFRHIAPGNFKYIDVRFGNKLFVNQQIETEPIENTEATTTSEVGGELSE